MKMLEKLLLLTLTTALNAFGAYPPSLRRLPLTINKVTEVNSFCDGTGFNVTLKMEQPFKGILFSKEFSQECRAFGTMTTEISVHLPTHGCGVRLSQDPETGRMFYTTTLVIQQDKHLRQIIDQERYVRCDVDTDAFKVRSKPMEDAVKDSSKKDHRTGRMKDEEGWSKDINQDLELEEALNSAKAWMEIVPMGDEDDKIQVGQDVMIVVKSTLPVGIGWRVIDCMAHDGLGDSSQKLLDQFGCPMDEALIPEFQKGPIKPISLMRHQDAFAKFAAFKFPDRDRLHISCGMQICRHNCNKTSCSNNRRSPREFSEIEHDDILDRLEVYNSVEVYAPGIELDERLNDRGVGDPLRATFGYIPGDKTFCVSPDKIAITFCILGLIFIFAVMVAAIAFYKARRSGASIPYYTRSLFSSSSGSGGGSAYGSKLLDSPNMGAVPSASVRGYGRIL